MTESAFRRSCLAVALAAAPLLLATVPGVAWSQAYPDKPVRMVVPFPAGGPVDVIGRLVAQDLSRSLQQQFLIDNRVGAGGTIASEFVAAAAPDGYTLLIGSTSTLAVAPALYPKLKYHPVKSFASIGGVSLETLALLVNPALPMNSVRDLVAHVKANPGKVNFGSPGTGTQTHLVSEMFKLQAGLDSTHVPYKGGAPSVVGAMAGEVQYLFNPMSTSVSMAKSGKLRLIGTTGTRRDALFPDVPTIAEAGLPDFEALFWIGLVAPAGTPREVVERLGREALRIADSREMADQLAKLGSTPYRATPEEFGRMVGREFDKWSELARKANIKVD